MKGGGERFARPGPSRAATCHFRASKNAMSSTRVEIRIVLVRVSVPLVSKLVLSKHRSGSLPNDHRDVVGRPVYHGEVTLGSLTVQSKRPVPIYASGCVEIPGGGFVESPSSPIKLEYLLPPYIYSNDL